MLRIASSPSSVRASHRSASAFRNKAPFLSIRISIRCNADPSDSGVAPTTASEPATSTSDQAGLAKGQGMALVTGGISLVFGFAYLALVVLLDRSGPMQPPPPEALGL